VEIPEYGFLGQTGVINSGKEGYRETALGSWLVVSQIPEFEMSKLRHAVGKHAHLAVRSVRLSFTL
jgi:hypothetical protein